MSECQHEMVRFNYDKMRVECDKCGELNNDKYEIVENEDGYSILCHQALNIIGKTCRYPVVL